MLTSLALLPRTALLKSQLNLYTYALFLSSKVEPSSQVVGYFEQIPSFDVSPFVFVVCTYIVQIEPFEMQMFGLSYFFFVARIFIK